MYDRRDEESLWPQMNRQANCGSAAETQLDMIPVVEMRWPEWKSLHPDTKVVSDGEGFDRTYPYESYEAWATCRSTACRTMTAAPRRNVCSASRRAPTGVLLFRSAPSTRTTRCGS